MYTWAAVSPWRFAVVQKLAGVFGRLGSWVIPGGRTKQGSWLRLPALTGWGLSKDFPAPASSTFHQRWEDLRTHPVQVLMQNVETPASSTPNANPEAATLDRLQTFSEELTALGAFCTLCREYEVAQRVLDLLVKHQTNQILAWDADRLPEGLLDALQESGIEVIYPSSETKDSNSNVLVGLTGAGAGIAETGSLFLAGGSGQPLSASLLPEVHIAILYEHDLYDHLSEVIIRQELREASAAVLISGPSRTADIEMTLTIGVHGPGELDVICITEPDEQQR
jgi:L-lactate dehydrogenase complex protein LldG